MEYIITNKRQAVRPSKRGDMFVDDVGDLYLVVECEQPISLASGCYHAVSLRSYSGRFELGVVLQFDHDCDERLNRQVVYLNAKLELKYA